MKEHRKGKHREGQGNNGLVKMSSSLPATLVMQLAAQNQLAAHQDHNQDQKIPDRFLVAIATNVWRLRKKMVDVEGNVVDNFAKVFRHVEAMEDALRELGVEIIDWDGKVYDTGYPIKVISSEKRKDLTREEIIETLSPTIKFDGRWLQCAEVVVGEPDSGTNNQKEQE